MGNSPTATLVFGYVFTDDNQLPWENPDEYKLNEQRREADWGPKDHYAYKLLKRDTIDDALKQQLWDDTLIEVEEWGDLCYGNPCYLIRPASEEAILNASWDYFIKINPLQELDVAEEWVKALKVFAEQMEIPLEDAEPRWHLIASYG